MKVLITGAGGFLGSHLIMYLKKIPNKNFKIFNLGRSEVKNSKLLYLDNINNKESINQHILELKPDYIFHLAGSSNMSADFAQSKLVNTDYSKFILDAIQINNLQHETKILITGSSAEYGKVNDLQLPISEHLIPNPESIYGKTKYKQTINAISWQKPNKSLVVVRPFNIIGSKMPIHLALGSFINQIETINNKGILKTGNLDTKRDFIDVNDVIKLMWKLINNSKAYGEIVNICSNKAVKISDILDLVIKLSGKDITVVNEETRMRKNDVTIHFGNNSKLIKIIGDYKFTSWENTIHNIMAN
tara:strand:- start:239 stop:1147 length:909 start_codon:yes stop_codon:yes gene_type:complete